MLSYLLAKYIVKIEIRNRLDAMTNPEAQPKTFIHKIHQWTNYKEANAHPRSTDADVRVSGVRHNL